MLISLRQPCYFIAKRSFDMKYCRVDQINCELRGTCVAYTDIIKGGIAISCEVPG